MSAKGRFVTLGVFVMVTIALVIAGVILLSAGVLGGNVVLLETYLEESVQGPSDSGSHLKPALSPL